MKNEERRKAFLHAGKDAWEHYRTTGRHVTGGEADAWLAELEAGNNIDPPIFKRPKSKGSAPS